MNIKLLGPTDYEETIKTSNADSKNLHENEMAHGTELLLNSNV